MFFIFHSCLHVMCISFRASHQERLVILFMVGHILFYVISVELLSGDVPPSTKPRIMPGYNSAVYANFFSYFNYSISRNILTYKNSKSLKTLDLFVGD